ncbi:hypothetical protein H6G89_23915 [Oscillatoria sp. FACHB-1407]|uniref:DUF6930 domain-containing protein n=1 Tax=Oscillatoria sp. FACHB-1407 TaxID=2692847 RepID=UPI0016830855|nr:hypothetical protein [Oscillatoria sp. FACHB-1407]MBD2464054.1 hypothetical protein [Oscillatoria sp. FACHB-1407]
MTALNRSTRRRLQQLRQIPSVWEGDRRALAPHLAMEPDSSMRGECILWVDGSEGLVRAMDVVPSDSGPEAIVRTLLRAMEYPHSSTRPARPQKIVVCDREIQFFLRGVLQELDIVVDYVPELPLIDEIFRGLQDVANNRPPQLPPEQEEALLKAAYKIWQDAPWDVLDEEKIISVEVNFNDVETLYVSILGMLGMEYGLLMYRSVDSLRKFRERVLMADDSPEDLEGAFLEQDCFFLTFEQEVELPEDASPDLSTFEAETGVVPTFGNLHPLEGMRPILYEEEAIAVLVALEAMHRFFEQHLAELNVEHFPPITGRYRINNPTDPKKKIPVKVETMTVLAEELFEMSSNIALDEADFNLANMPILRVDLIPRDAFYSLGAMAWEITDILRSTAKHYQAAETEIATNGDGFPVILIQTSRPKAIALIEELQAAGGVKAICFNPGEDPYAEQRYDLGILQTHNGDFHLFGEFIEDDPIHIEARKKWDQRCKRTNGYCGLVIAKGFKGSNRGNPSLNDMMALFEVRSISAKELGLGPLELSLQFE